MALEKRHIEGDPATLFIPDISGFTQFIDETAMVHSRRIVAELLETLIDANELGFSVSEIEGDAILFYRFGAAPSLEDIAQQAEKMFRAFHERLLHYERDRICDCEACSTARRLSLEDILPRIGSSHQCFLPGMVLYIETQENRFEQGKVEFVERVLHMPMVPEANVFSTLEETEDGLLRFTVNVYYLKSLLGKLLTPVLKLVMRHQFRSNALLFKRFVEKAYELSISRRDQPIPRLS